MNQDYLKKRLESKVILITGAASGIGKLTAIKAAKEGAKLVLADQNEDVSYKTLNEIKNITSKVEFMVTDLGDSHNCKKLVDLANDTFGTIDILVNADGVDYITEPVDRMSPSIFKKIIETNVFVAFCMCHYTIPIMKKGGGSIINISSRSILDFDERYLCVSYDYGLNSLTSSMASEYIKDNIRVNSINLEKINNLIYKKELKNSNKLDLTGSNLASFYKNNFKFGSISDINKIIDIILLLSSDESKNITGISIPTKLVGSC